jgi:hypothetical protein
LPQGAQRTWIQMDPISGDDFIKARQNGAFEDVDYINSNFKTDVWYRSNSPCAAYKNINERLENLHASKTLIKLNWIGRWPQDFMQKV